MKVMAQRAGHQSECRFCSVLSGAGDAFDSMWLRDARYRALVSVGALVPGWTLICPARHVVNLGDDYGRSDFWDFAGAAATTLEQRYGACAYFEHGSSSELSLTGCGVGHAHGHLVPVNFDLETESRHYAPELQWTRCRALDVQTSAAGQEYLFVAARFEGANTLGSLCVLNEPTSQFFRRVIAKNVGMEDMYDYKKYPMLDIAAKSAEDLRGQATAVLAKA